MFALVGCMIVIVYIVVICQCHLISHSTSTKKMVNAFFCEGVGGKPVIDYATMLFFFRR